MDAITIKHASAMPAPTWSWLRMNDTDIRIPDGLERACDVKIEAGDGLTSRHASFEGALADLQERLDAARAGAADGRASVRAATEPDRGAADLETPALSAYEKRAVLEEVEGDVAKAFETGVGRDARSYLNMLAGGTVVLASEENAAEKATVSIQAAPGTASSSSIDVVAAPGSRIELAVSIDAAGSGAGLVGNEMRVFAGAGAKVDVTVYVTADDGFTAIDDSGFVLDEGARVNVRHEVLGGGFTATGLAADLRGDGSKIAIDTRYLAAREEVRDYNYIVRHRGRKTECAIDANGVLTGTSKKTLRGTIDLVHGCKGSQGNERETVLLANRGVENKTVPVILCDEDDVAGNHGATIGHVRPEQLFYAACRGLSEQQAEDLFISAKLADAAIAAPNEGIRANVVRLGGRLIEGFEEEIS